MIRTTACLILCLTHATAGAAIYKCKAPSTNAVTYTDRSCPPGQQQAQHRPGDISWIQSGGRLDRKPAIRALLQQAKDRSQRERETARRARQEISKNLKRQKAACASARLERRKMWNAPREKRRTMQRKEFEACR